MRRPSSALTPAFTAALTAALAAALGLATAAGCSKRRADGAAPAEAQAAIPAISVDDLDGMLAKGGCVPVDANGEGTRRKMGVIPGAVLLTDSEAFVPSELPADKARPLVFYCANEACGASHEAAAKARLAGHQDVKVLPVGIAGWKKAGKPTQAI